MSVDLVVVAAKLHDLVRIRAGPYVRSYISTPQPHAEIINYWCFPEVAAISDPIAMTILQDILPSLVYYADKREHANIVHYTSV